MCILICHHHHFHLDLKIDVINHDQNDTYSLMNVKPCTLQHYAEMELVRSLSYEEI